MRRWSALSRTFLATLAGILAFVAILCGSLWMYAVRYPGPVVELGFNQLYNPHYDSKAHSLDGITEARNANGEEFGESSLIAILCSYGHLPVGPLLQAVVGTVQRFSASEQEDDSTMVIARSLA